MTAALASAAPAPIPTDAEHPNALAVGTRLGEYKIERILGAGGFGITYLAWDRHLEKHVAIKEYLPATLAVRALDGSVVPVATQRKHDYAWGLDRFVKEARTLARFTHPHIVRVNRYFEACGTAYMVMDYEAGESLSTWLRRNPRPGEQRLRAILLPLLDGLEAVHSQRFLHRDIKPSNIFLREQGTPVLIDFGSARQANGNQTRTLTSIVSPGYAPLEQYSSDGNQGPWTDIYSLSAVLYRAIMNENPPEAAARVQQDVLLERLAAVEGRYSPGFLAAMRWGLAVDERRRPQSVGEWRPVFLGQPVVAAPGRSNGGPVIASTRESGPSGSAGALQVVRGASPKAASVAPDAAKTFQPPPMMRWVGISLVAVAALGYWLRGPGGGAATAKTTTDHAAVVHMVPADLAPAVREQFQQIDADGDGSITRSEAARRAPRLAAAFEAVDANADGVLSPAEFRSFAQIDLGIPRPRPAQFNESTEPARRIVSAPPPDPVGAQRRDMPAGDPLRVGAPALAREFDFADRNHDGFLTPDEARDRMPFVTHNFGDIDLNRDGRVSREEVARFHRSIRPRAEHR